MIKNDDTVYMQNIGKQYVLHFQSLFDLGNSTGNGRFTVIMRA